MPQNVISLWTDHVVDMATFTPAPTAGVPVDLLVSSPIANTIYNSMKLSIKYEDVVPAGVLGSFYVMAEVDFRDANGNWRLLPVYQGQALRKSTQAPERILIMQPNIVVQNLGEVESVFRGPFEICQISRAQGALPEGDARVRVVLVENDPGGANALSSIKITAEFEQYSV